MWTVDDLEADHGVLREAVTQLEAMLTAPVQIDRVEVAHGILVRLLEGHLRKAKELAAPCALRIEATVKQHVPFDRADAEVVERDLDVLKSAWRVVPTGALVNHLCRLLEELREGLEEEARDVFPVLRYCGTQCGRQQCKSVS
ncbi:MAG: hypothetical protein HYT90_00770 [Candidatus Omnitrophica bacterium]|nr:hypothetical protein [Candidatus Omnitrophota bacterium]